MWFNGSLGGYKRRSSNAGLQNLNLHEWQELLQRKWAEFTGDNFEFELSKLFSEFLYCKKKDVLKWLEFIPAEFYEKSKSNVLHFLTKEGNYDVLKEFLSSNCNCDINAKNAEGQTPLLIAILNNNKRIAKLLLKAGATLDNNYYNEHYGPVHYAAEIGSFEMLKMLIEEDANVSKALDHNFNSPLHILLKYSDRNDTTNKSDRDLILKSITTMLIKAGTDVNSMNSSAETALHVALSKSLHDLASHLLMSGADCNAKDEDSRTALHLAVRKNNEELCIELVEQYRADVNAIDAAGMSPLCYTIKKYNRTLTKLLLDNGASTTILHTCDDMDAIFEAVKANDIRLLSLLLQAEPGLKTSHEFECIRLAFCRERMDIMKKLMESGIDVTVRNSEGSSPIFFNIANYKLLISDEEELLHHLMKRGAALNLIPAEREKLFYPMIRDFNVANIQNFLTYSRIELSEFDPSQLLKYACRNQRNEVFRFIVEEFRSVIHTIKIEGMPLAHYLAGTNSTAALKYSLEMGIVDVDCLANADDTPLHRALKCNEPENFKLLLLFGACLNVKAVNMLIERENLKIYAGRYAVREIALIELPSKNRIHEEYYRLINSDRDLQTFYHKCLDELVIMKDHKISASVTLQDVILRPYSYFKNPLVIPAVARLHPFNSLPNYREVIMMKLEDMRMRLGLITDAETAIIRLVTNESNVTIPEIIVENILSYLDNRDLLALILVYKTRKR